MPVPPGQTGGFESAAGSGEVRCCQLLDGVTAMRMRLEMDAYTETRTQTGLLEINFCAAGRFETRFSLREHVLLKPGDRFRTADPAADGRVCMDTGSIWHFKYDV